MKLARVFSRLPVGAFSALALSLLLWLTLAPKPLGDTSLRLFPGADKVVHGVMFGGVLFALCFDMGLRQWKRRLPVAWPAATLAGLWLFVTLLGGLIELLQQAMGIGRGAEWLDFAADALGALVSAWVSPLLLSRLFR